MEPLLGVPNTCPYEVSMLVNFYNLDKYLWFGIASGLKFTLGVHFLATAVGS